VLVEAAGIITKGTKGWLKSFAQPMAAIAFMNVLELLIRPLSLCMRLFGNILGATVIMELAKSVIPVLFPAALSLYFDLFDGAIQAYVFCFLTSLYIKEAVE
jgi:F-type H+-transporting ATPase subunit a